MSQVMLSSWFRRICRGRPITISLVVVLLSLLVAVQFKTTPEHDREAAYRELGLLEIQHSSKFPELFGPFDLWAGQWWRVPLGGLHQAGWWHLAIVVPAFVYLGGLLEAKVHRATYACFLLGALLITTIPRWLGGDSIPAWFIGKEPITGLSGVIFAQYGLLLLLRRHDPRLSQRFGEGGILLGMVAGLGCLAFSTIGLGFGVDNLAHLAGLPYGCLWGFILSFPLMARRILVVAFLGGHAVLWPVFDRLMHPSENARYHWWQAEHIDDPDIKRQCYQAALKCDPNLQAPWLALVELDFQNHQPTEAWRTLMKGLRQHPHLEGAEDLSRRIWAAFNSDDERREAWQEAKRKVSESSIDWSGRLLSPGQSASFLMEENLPLEAWLSLMHHLRELPPPNRAEADSHLAEVLGLAQVIWRNLGTRRERLQALRILDEQLDLNRRAWQLALIPHQDLIPHYQQLGEAIWAWQAVMEELRDDPAFYQKGKQTAVEIWETFPTELRRERARKILEDVFGLQGLNWQIELGILSEATKQRYRLDQALQLPTEPLDGKTFPPTDRLPAFDPDDPDSAALGNRL
jgi:rhomboid protease GluP